MADVMARATCEHFVGWVDKPSVRGIITAIAGFINPAYGTGDTLLRYPL